MLKKKLNDLKVQRAALVGEAEKALADRKTDLYEQKMADVEAMNGEIANVEKLLTEKGRYAPFAPAPSDSTDGDKEDKSKSQQLKELRSSPEYARAWLKSLQIPKGMYSAELEPLHKALTLSGGDPVGEDGGFLAPLDFETMVHTLAKDYIDLSAHINVEQTAANSGWRIIETAATRTALPVIAEGATINPDQQPTFKRVEYTCQKHGDRILISRELANDAPALMRYLADWFAPKYVMTKNALILNLLKKLPFTALSGDTDAAKVRELKRVLNTGLNTAHSRSAVLLTNQGGYDEMDGWVDGNGRAMLVPDLSGDFSRFKNRPVIFGDNDLITDHAAEGVTYAPLFIGALRSFATLFLREGMTVDATNIGGKAWETGGTEIRVIARMGIAQMDENAVKFCGLQMSE